MSIRARRLWIGREPATAFCWLVAWSLLASGALVYWLSPGTVLFEHWFGLPSAETVVALPDAVTRALLAIRHLWPDLCWAYFAGIVARDLCWAVAGRVPGPVVLVAALSWELGQGLDLLPGVFTWPDFSVSMAAGLAAVFCGAAKGEGQE